jgi:hypothetical protein
MIYKIQSSSDIENYYEIDSDLITCTCPSYVEDRSIFSAGDPRRLCKHLIRVFLEKKILPECFYFYREEIERLANIKRGFHHGKKVETFLNNEKIEAFIPTFEDIKSSWVTLFFKGSSYRYCPITKQWSNAKTPPNKTKILQWISTQIKPIMSKINYEKMFGNKS